MCVRTAISIMGLSTSSLVVQTGTAVPAFVLDLLVVGLSTGLVGSSILDRLRGESESDDEDPLLDDDGAFGGDDGLGGEFGDFEDDEWGDDPFGEGGDDDESTAELEKRLDDLENEVATLSSTVGTVRSENEQISGTVEDVEEDVRQLLDIYEMVTRGINPFVDDAGGMGGGFDDDSFGLFEDDGGDDDDELDAEIAGADAEGFFDEELVEPSDEDPFAEAADAFDDGAFGEETDSDSTAGGAATEDSEDDDMASDDTTGGKSFEELKAEYDSGDADWADDTGGDDTGGDDPLDDGGDELGDPFEDDLDAGFDDGLGEGLDDDLDDSGDAFSATTETFESTSDDGQLGTEPELDEPDVRSNGHHEPADPAMNGQREARNGHHEPNETGSAGGRATTGRQNSAGNGFQFLGDDDVVDGPERPYLEALPGGYITDLLVMEWLEFLVDEGTVTDAARAVNYYHRVGWVAEPVAADLQEFLTGFGDVDLNRVNEPGCDHLTPAHHQKSLKYVMQLSGATAQSLVVDRWDSLSGVGNGL